MRVAEERSCPSVHFLRGRARVFTVKDKRRELKTKDTYGTLMPDARIGARSTSTQLLPTHPPPPAPSSQPPCSRSRSRSRATHEVHEAALVGGGRRHPGEDRLELGLAVRRELWLVDFVARHLGTHTGSQVQVRHENGADGDVVASWACARVRGCACGRVGPTGLRRGDPGVGC